MKKPVTTTGFFLLRVQSAFDDVCLDYAEYVRYRPIQNQSRRHPCKHYRKDNRQPLHHAAGLRHRIITIGAFIAAGLQVLLQPHCRAHKYRQDKVRVHRRQIVYPQKVRVPHIYRNKQCLVKCKENRNLNQHRQAPRHRRSFMRAI